MEEARAVPRGDPAGYDWPDPRSIPLWITSDHKALFYELFFWGNGAGGETRTPNRPITNRVLYQLSHASHNRLFTRDFCVVNSCLVKKCLLAKSTPFHDR